ncbi:sigma-54-dependent transcriptional regulator [Paenisporosarcina antarctica]|uniref:Sigma-54-dependent Fis family transcriptional regulator n=1 Tax=Paenisporosarcina antarctica TaxID=417367 RepID=A0A4P7A0E0_9BACL|nr:sigma-54 dependent transcriptional regulator [Paenisporosarcina antarctica]QBP41849.1 sigma-54-dependent Fis family transcriptional regulator [Paenisporosarcina antarctica]
MNSILIVDDESKLLKIFQSSLTKKNYTIYTAANGQEARRKIYEQDDISIVFLDLKLPDCSGLDLLQEFVSVYPTKIFIMMTAYGNIENAVIAMKTGAFDYIVKPVKLHEIIVVIEKAIEWLKVKQENHILKEKLKRSETNGELLGTSKVMKQILLLIERVSNTNANVLLEGESGTGKSMIAEAMHKLSDRSHAPFIPVNCASIPEQLLESELFGHEKGSFTGAVSARKGKFVAANGGTIFLDEIGEITPAFQAKLLQVTQNKTFIPVGSDSIKQVEVRIITATNRNLKKMVEEGKFREDLFYRLNIVDIYIPPLRERKDDIPLLVNKFLDKHRKKYERDYQISGELMRILINYQWPGNVRELENAIERAVVLAQDQQLSIDDFHREIREVNYEPSVETNLQESGKSLPEQMEDIEKKLILKALDDALGQQSVAARKLGISRQSLLYKMNKFFNLI